MPVAPHFRARTCALRSLEKCFFGKIYFFRRTCVPCEPLFRGSRTSGEHHPKNGVQKFTRTVPEVIKCIKTPSKKFKKVNCNKTQAYRLQKSNFHLKVGPTRIIFRAKSHNHQHSLHHQSPKTGHALPGVGGGGFLSSAREETQQY